jgi:hypothetical protein
LIINVLSKAGVGANVHFHLKPNGINLLEMKQWGFEFGARRWHTVL